MRILLASAAALALASAGAHAGPGEGRGHDKHGAQDAAHKRDIGKPARALDAAQRREARSTANRAAAAEHGPTVPRDTDRRKVGAVERTAIRAAAVSDHAQSEARPGHRMLADPRDRAFLSRDRSRSLIAGCPPGLVRQEDRCRPRGEGQRQQLRARSWHGYDYRPRLFGLTTYASADDYYFADGYLLRASAGGGVAGYIPLLGGALAIGNVWPADYASLAVPDYYVDYYDLGGAPSYRFADNVIYRVDPASAAIASVAAVLAGDDFVVGEIMPPGYDVYNVPYSFRERYADSTEAWYRYSDGYVYRIDPRSRRIAAAIDLLI